jgi:hypothetical protein
MDFFNPITLIPATLKTTSITDVVLLGSIMLVNLKAKFFRRDVEFIKQHYGINLDENIILTNLSIFGLFYLYTRNLNLSLVFAVMLSILMLILKFFSIKEIITYTDDKGKTQYILREKDEEKRKIKSLFGF